MQKIFFLLILNIISSILLTSAGYAQTQINAYGKLVGPSEISGWRLVDISPGAQDYILIDIEKFQKQPWFNVGNWVQVTGIAAQEQSPCPQLGTAIKVQNIVPASPVQAPPENIEIIGKLQRTVEAGGWVITNTDAAETYLLLLPEQYRQQAWFTEGSWVKVSGCVKRDAVTIYMQGTPLQVSKIEPVNCRFGSVM